MPQLWCSHQQRIRMYQFAITYSESSGAVSEVESVELLAPISGFKRVQTGYTLRHHHEFDISMTFKSNYAQFITPLGLALA